MNKEDVVFFLMEKIKELTFAEVKPSDKIVSTRILDSIALVDLTVAIEDRFGIKVQNAEMTEENFNSIDLISNFILTKQNNN